MQLQELLAMSNGARFFRADLHIHSLGASHDVKDPTMTPEAIVATATAEGLDVIAITDHNEISNVRSALVAASNSTLLVIPGIELSTPQGHLLCYLPNIDSLEKFFGRLSIVDRGSANSRCQNAILDCLNQLGTLSGFAILAHVDTASGFEIENPGNSPHKLDIICHRALLGIELKNAASDIHYSDWDRDVNRKTLGRKRIEKLSLGSNQFLARVLGSDAHTLNALGRNASGVKKVTRIKMASPSFSALRIALEDCDARVRIEDQIPSTIPRIAGLSLEGGFMHGQKIHFSPNLNCIIGGRGTGKSTTFEAARCLTGKESDNPVVDCEVWPTNINLFWCDQANEYHALRRDAGMKIVNTGNPENGPTSFQIECYGQGETEKICKDAQSNPIALLAYLDRFVDLSDLQQEENNARNELLIIQEEIEKATKNVNLIASSERSLAVTQQQLAALEKAKAKEVIELSRQLASESEIRAQVIRKVNEIKLSIDGLSPKNKIDEIARLARASDLTIGPKEFEKMVADAREFGVEAINVQNLAKAEYSKLATAIQSQVVQWKSKEDIARNTIETLKKQLAAQNIPLDMRYIQKLANEEAQLQAYLNTLKTWIPYLAEQKKLYKLTAKRRWDARERIAMTRGAYAKEASEILKSGLTDLSVSLKFSRSAYSPDAEEQIKQAMGWRTSQVPRASLMIKQLTMPELVKAIDNNDASKIMTVVTAEKTTVFDRAEAERIIEKLSIPEIRFALERCPVYDLPQLIVTKTIQNPNGSPTVATRDFAKLSLGQQQSVLLALMLSAKSKDPLIIDQPEDNLDGEFIYHSLVPVLRLAKERRQIIIVTHNANIAVLGDAEQIIVLKSSNEKSVIVSRGSIDDTATRDVACKILEGAREAFERRAKIYGLQRAQ
ncbi:AAA family ATPase [Chryseolinea sp. T2]|uniref:TrlF family AAA-like ATPase n=1 Tax=Chryseolinea sp. T2 TaxID=3129255 RepID=UPI003078A1E9